MGLKSNQIKRASLLFLFLDGEERKVKNRAIEN
jgi:hypothetical protein